MKAQTMGDPVSMEFMKSRRVFEINPDHSIIRNLDVWIFFVMYSKFNDNNKL